MSMGMANCGQPQGTFRSKLPMKPSVVAVQIAVHQQCECKMAARAVPANSVARGEDRACRFVCSFAEGGACAPLDKRLTT